MGKGVLRVMIICDKNHGPIVYQKLNYNECPYCAVLRHMNETHDFIESIDGLVPKLLEYQKKRKEEKEGG